MNKMMKKQYSRLPDRRGESMTREWYTMFEKSVRINEAIDHIAQLGCFSALAEEVFNECRRSELTGNGLTDTDTGLGLALTAMNIKSFQPLQAGDIASVTLATPVRYYRKLDFVACVRRGEQAIAEIRMTMTADGRRQAATP